MRRPETRTSTVRASGAVSVAEEDEAGEEPRLDEERPPVARAPELRYGRELPQRPREPGRPDRDHRREGDRREAAGRAGEDTPAGHRLERPCRPRQGDPEGN